MIFLGRSLTLTLQSLCCSRKIRSELKTPDMAQKSHPYFFLLVFSLNKAQSRATPLCDLGSSLSPWECHTPCDCCAQTENTTLVYHPPLGPCLTFPSPSLLVIVTHVLACETAARLLGVTETPKQLSSTLRLQLAQAPRAESKRREPSSQIRESLTLVQSTRSSHDE